MKGKTQDRWRRRRKKFISLGLCYLCGKNKPRAGILACVRCSNIKNSKRRTEENRKKGREKYWKNRDVIIVQMRESFKRAKLQAIEYYGGKCNCCGEKNTEFLQIDHIGPRGVGAKHRKAIGSRISIWLRKNNYPKGFRVLCANCNFSMGTLGYCPHKNKK